MNTPTHAETTKLADQIWREKGRPTGRDTAIWLEAERQLTEETAAKSEDEAPLSTAQPEKKAKQAATRKKEARASQVAQQRVPKPPPAQTGKPLRPQPHSS